MAARLTDKQKKKIIADYLELGSYNAAAKANGVAKNTVRRVIANCADFDQKVQQKKEQNTIDVLAYVESKRKIVCEIFDKAFRVLNDEEKLREATPSQITTALGTLIDKFAMISGVSGEQTEEDELSKSLRELGEELSND